MALHIGNSGQYAMTASCFKMLLLEYPIMKSHYCIILNATTAHKLKRFNNKWFGKLCKVQQEICLPGLYYESRLQSCLRQELYFFVDQ